MKNYRKHIDDFFREKLGAYSETPPPEVWDDLEKRLDGIGTTGTPGKPYRWLWHFAIVSVLLFLGVSVFRKTTDSPKNRDIALKSTSNPGTGNTQTGVNINPTTQQAGTAGGSTTLNAIGTVAGNAFGNSQTTTNNPVAFSNNNSNGRNSNRQRPIANNTQPGASANPGQPGASTSGNNGQYASNGSKHGPLAEENTGNNQSTTVIPNAAASKQAAAGTQTTNGASKQNQQSKAKTSEAVKQANQHKAIGFNRFEAGVKLGYEGGYTDGAASKAVIAPYLQYNVSRKFALMIQPAIKEASVSGKNIGNPQSYYAIDPETGTTTPNDYSYLQYHGATLDTIHQTTWTYSQRHDSIVKSNVFRGNYTEAELPILLKYGISKRWSVYGGVNLVYSRLVGVTENTYVKSGILKSMTTDTITTINGTPQPPKNVGITYSGTPYSSYRGPAYPGTPESQIRVGYMLGFSYAFSKKWLFDGLVEQAPAAADMKGGYNISTPLSSTYFRLSIGYKLTK